MSVSRQVAKAVWTNFLARVAVLLVVSPLVGCGTDGELPAPTEPLVVHDTISSSDAVTASDSSDPAELIPPQDTSVIGPSSDIVPTPDVPVAEDTGPVDPCAEAPFGFLCACEANADCDTGYCVPTIDPVTPRVCTIECVESCPNDWPCQGVQRGPDLLFLCLPQANTLCALCATDADCGTHGERCLTYDDGQFCGRDCSGVGVTCPENYTCESVTVGGLLERQCQPASGSCKCGPEIDLSSDPNNCGTCGHVCAFDGADAACNDEACALGACKPGHINLDHLADNGCEYACLAATLPDLPDDGVDQNCDGIDGDIALAWFVAPSGADGAAGTPDEPLRTVSEAVTKAAAHATRKQIYVAAGTYTGTLVLQSGVSIYGGFGLPTTPPAPGATPIWTRSPTTYQTTLQSSVVDGSGDVRVVTGDSLTSGLLDGLYIVSGNATTAGGSSYGVWLNGATSDFVIASCSITAGAGAPGNDGSGGVIGKDGAIGGDGRTTTDTDCNCNEFSTYGGVGGGGGAAACPGGLGAGGAGADSACGDANGNGGHNAAEGTAGGPYGSPGSTGPDGPPGGPGQGGGLGAVDVNGRWSSQAGGDGGPGDPGKGGGGGSSGKGADGGTFGCGAWGGGGGGGGSAGCGGTGGLGGTGGGGSFAIFVARGEPTLKHNLLTRGTGGKGGAGGKGASGGLGKDGGAAGGGNNGSGSGQKGGKGGNGGAGGAGGGGAGGPSFGLFIGDKASPTCLLNSYEGASTGGEGGPSDASPGKAGLSGDKNKPSSNCL